MSTLSEKSVRCSGNDEFCVTKFANVGEGVCLTKGRRKKAFGMLLDSDWRSGMDFLVHPLLGW